MRAYVLVKRIIDGPELYWAIPYDNSGMWSTDINKAKHYKSERAAHIGWTAVSKRHSKVEVLETEENLAP